MHTKHRMGIPTAVYILAAFTALAVVVMTVLLCIPKRSHRVDFVPPAFEKEAIQGTPDVPALLGYLSPYQEGMAYRFSVCGNVTIDGDGSAVVYMTNPVENEVYLKLRILDEEDHVLGETGLLKPGEYVRCVELMRIPSSGEKLKMKIMGYEPETYNSAGAVLLNTIMGGSTRISK